MSLCYCLPLLRSGVPEWIFLLYPPAQKALTWRAGLGGRRRLRQQQAGTNEEEHDGEYDRQRASRQPRCHPASDEDARNAAPKERTRQSKVHVAVKYVCEAGDEREDPGVGDVGTHNYRRGERVEQEEYHRHHAPASYGGETHEIASGCPEEDGEEATLQAHL